ncbi:MAG: membrane protein insertase YidC, partial [Robiginitalea sp.]
MEEKKLDLNSIIGFLLIFGILLFWFYLNQPTPEELEAEKQAAEQVEQPEAQETKAAKPLTPVEEPVTYSNDSLAQQAYAQKVGAFSYTAVREGFTELENEVLYLKVSNRGGQVVEARMKEFDTYDSVPVYLVRDGNALFNLQLATQDNRLLQTKDLFFEPSLTNEGEDQVLSMRAKAGPDQYLEYRYTLRPGEYLLDFDLRSQGLSTVLSPAQPAILDWQLRGIRHNKSVMYGNRYTRLTYRHEGEDISKLSESGDDEETEIDVRWMSFRQHFFSSILAADEPFPSVDMTSRNLVEEENKEVHFTKEFAIRTSVEPVGGELSKAMHWYYGPTDVAVLKNYEDLALADSIPYGWGIFGWINRYLFTPFFSFLSSFLPFGIAIVVMTIIVRILMSPVTYKSYLSQAKMKVLKPEITEINEKFKDNAMKRQQ